MHPFDCDCYACRIPDYSGHDPEGPCACLDCLDEEQALCDAAEGQAEEMEIDESLGGPR